MFWARKKTSAKTAEKPPFGFEIIHDAPARAVSPTAGGNARGGDERGGDERAGPDNTRRQTDGATRFAGGDHGSGDHSSGDHGFGHWPEADGADGAQGADRADGSDGAHPHRRHRSIPARTLFAGIFVMFAVAYAVAFNIVVRVSPEAALARYEILVDDHRYRAAAPYGARAISLLIRSGAPEAAVNSIRADYARTLTLAGKPADGAAVYRSLLSTDWFRDLNPLDQGVLRDHMARSELIAGNVSAATRIYLSFVEQAQGFPFDGHHGDETAEGAEEGTGYDDPLYAFTDGAVMRAATLFSESLKPVGNEIDLTATDRDRALAEAAERAELGAFYATREDALYAAAGLLSSSYDMRAGLLGADHPEAVRTALILGPVYERLMRLSDAEALYLSAFHAQEKTKGSNNPDLSLYIKLLVGVYERQGRSTEAAALKEHMRTIFRDAFGAQRYAVNRDRDRRQDVDRPVSKQFVLGDGYEPEDLVPAARYGLPLSKNPDLEEMSLRFAADANASLDPREANMPVRLAQLISLCVAETGEALSLRSGYRSFATQRTLFARLGDKGTVVPPGMSEHQLGLAADIDVNGRMMRQSDQSFQCFEENAFRFGFILSYPPGNQYLPTRNSFEPWHWRYVGVQTAQLYREMGPFNRPQEFLNRLPCYVERATAGGDAPLGETDPCLSDDIAGVVVATSGDDGPGTSAADTARAPDAPSPATARKLNNRPLPGRKPTN